MISVEEALGKILANITILENEEKPILDSLGQVIAEDIYATYNIPPEDNSGMDGYATRSEYLVGASQQHPIVLRIIGEQPAGFHTEIQIVDHTCIKIMTGATLPPHADVVIPFEDTDRESRPSTDREIGIFKHLQKGANVRFQGEDVKKGTIVFSTGRLVQPAEIGMLASLGIGKVKVIRRPIIGVIATGSELMEIGSDLVPGKIYNSNSYSIAALITKFGGIPKILGIAIDNKTQITNAVRRGLNYDMLITSGGVSVGDYDVVRDVLMAEGNMSFWRVRMKPGKPLAFGMLKRNNGNSVPHIGLPGNPASCMVTFEIFGKPAIYKMMGRNDWQREPIKAIFEDSVVNEDGRRIYARVAVTKKDGKYYANLAGVQGSAIMTSMVNANGLAIIPENISKIGPGHIVDVLLLD